MKKTILLLMVGLLFIGANLYAAGDLIVDGQIGIGKAPALPLDIEVTDTDGMKIYVHQNTDTTAIGLNITQSQDNSTGIGLKSLMGVNGANTITTVKAIEGQIRNGGTGDITIMRAGNFETQLRSNNDLSLNIDTVMGFDNVIRDAGSRNAEYNINNVIGWRTTTFFDVVAASGNKVLVENLYGGYVKATAIDPLSATITNNYGLYLEAQTVGTNNAGIVLDGEGAGSDLVFGYYDNGQGFAGRPRLYSSQGQLKVEDAFGNQTIFSPHDPETGEWIYYSKNTKTGVVKRVNMEQLVKAVEKLTGETFMVETIEEIE